MKAPAAPVTTPPAATLGLARTASVSSKRVASLTLRCSSSTGTCSGRLTLTVTTRKHGSKRARTITLGRARYSLKAGSATPVKVKLSGAGYALLRAARGHRLRVTATSVPTSGHGLTGKVTLVAKASK